MSLPLIIQCIASAICVGVVCFCMAKWRQGRMMYFTLMAISICIITVGYMLELTAGSFDGALVATRVQYYGAPFLGVTFYLFCRQYCEAPIRRLHVAALLVLPAAVALLVQTWPWLPWMYRALAYDTTGVVPHMVVTPGPMYYAMLGYNIFTAVMAGGVMLRYGRRAGPSQRRHLWALLGFAALPFLSQVQHFTGTYLLNWDLTPLTLALALLGMAYYITRFRQREWQGLGRELVVENMQDAFILVDDKDRFWDCNRMARQYFPALEETAPGTALAGVQGLPPELLQGDGHTFTLPGKEDEPLHLRVSRTTLTRQNGELLGISIMVYDETESHQLMRELQQIATHDALTGLLNRGTFFSYATRDYALCQRRREAGSVLMMDIDHFKAVNDKHGHAAGDMVLKQVAETLRSRLRHTDISGRYGGEELAVWLPGAAADGAAVIADVIRRAVQHTVFETEYDEQFSVTLSIGVADIDYARAQDFDDVVNEADKALYTAKNQGRNRVVVYHYQPPVVPAGGKTEPAPPPAPAPMPSATPAPPAANVMSETGE